MITEKVHRRTVTLRMMNHEKKKLTQRMFWEIFTQPGRAGILVVEQWGWKHGKGKVQAFTHPQVAGNYIRQKLIEKIAGSDTSNYEVVDSQTEDLTRGAFIDLFDKCFAEADRDSFSTKRHVREAALKLFEQSETGSSFTPCEVVQYASSFDSAIRKRDAEIADETELQTIADEAVRPYQNFGDWA